MNYLKIIFVLLLFPEVGIFAQQDTIFNQTDANGLKQGYWKKAHPNGKLMYTGYFKNNKPVGEMRRYYESGALRAILFYNSTGERVRAREFYQSGKIAAEGNYVNSKRDSTWVYYSFYSGSVTSRESYSLGVRDGMMINYYPNGDVSEKIGWKNDKKSGIWEQYFLGNILRLKAGYSDNKLQGDFIVYNTNGEPYIQGKYVNDLREGRWIIHKEDGSIARELDYKQGKSADEAKLEKEQQELFKQIDENMGKFEEPNETDFLGPSAK
jgi:antitoxin component YwqK of YwqJK toxin-antitoxin module